MTDRFEECLPLVLVHEGGYVNHPKDPGGATNKGVTQKTYDAWNDRAGKTRRSVKHITEDELRAIYRMQYWDKVSADELPVGLDYAVFDFAVNSGPSRGAKFLQRAVGVPDDGIIGAQTLAAVKKFETQGLIRSICDARLAWLKRLKHWPTFGKGWTRRVNEVKGAAQAMAGGQGYQDPVGEAQGRGNGAEKPTATIGDMAKDPKVWGSGFGLLGGLGGIMSGDGPVQYAIAVAIVIGVSVLAYHTVRK